MSDTAYGIESFLLLDDGEPEQLLSVEGWFHTPGGIRGMQLAIPDGPIMVEKFAEPSPGLISLFGETGRNCRFRHETRVGADAVPKLPGSRLLVLLGNGDGMTIDISPMLQSRRAEPPPTYTEEERALVMRFEGLGDNCEFGLMQREVGRERLSLLRYGGSRETWRLVDAVRTGFEGFGTEDDLSMTTFHSEWIATSRRYGFTFHTGEHVDAVAEDTIRAAESTKLTFMAGMLVEDMESCTKVFVRRVADEQPLAGMDDLYAALAARGPAVLLWVTPADEAHGHGTVEHHRDGLFRGWHGSFAPYSSALDYDSRSWVTLLRAAEAAINRWRGVEAPAPVVATAPEPAGEPAPDTDPAPTAAAEEEETASWRVLTGAEAAPADAAPPQSEIPPPPDDGGFIGRLFGRRRPENG